MNSQSMKILCVDDEPNVLAGYSRQLRKEFTLETAVGGEAALEALRTQGPFAVVVSDMRMPGMSGVELLCRVRELAPDTVRIMLTGNNDQQTAIAAINEGSIFRFLTKPCPADQLAIALRAGLEQHRLITAEKELLEQTLRGSTQVLAEVLSLTSPVAFGRALRVQRLVRNFAEHLKVKDIWQIEVAALLSQIGCVTVPEQVLAKVYGGGDVAEHERAMYDRHAEIGAGLVAKIPRLEAVANIIACQEKHFDGSGLPNDGNKEAAIPLGARILKVALDFDALASRGQTKSEVIKRLMDRPGWYDPVVVGLLDSVTPSETGYSRISVPINKLHAGMILDEGVFLETGMMLVGKGQEITETLRLRLQNLSAQKSIRQPIVVLIATEL